MNKIVFFDTDILSSFLWTHHEFILTTLYAKQMSIARQVYQEISKVPVLKKKIDQMIFHGDMDIIDIDIGSEAEKLYVQFISGTWNQSIPIIGKGEAASIALSFIKGGILASNNLKDVQHYVQHFGLNHLMTMVIIHLAYQNQMLTMEACDQLVIKMIKSKRRLPFETFSAYLSSKI